MAYTNSPMTVYIRLSPHHSGQRTHVIDRITPHCEVLQCSAEEIGDSFANPGRQVSSNYHEYPLSEILLVTYKQAYRKTFIMDFCAPASYKDV